MSLLLKKHIREIIPALSDQEFEYVMRHFVPVKRQKHQFLIQADDEVKSNYWVVKGCLKLYCLDDDGKEHILQFAMENWWVSDYIALYSRGKSEFYISCIEDSELLSITMDNIDKLCSEMHAMEHFWNVKKRFGYVALQKRIVSLLKNSAEERYNQLLEQYPQLLQRVPKKMIASYLGVSRETLSRFNAGQDVM
ncbi:Crp/Fnr family transcriptional regulator [Ohtaekwangia koreensis]|jgi:CRP-like cAMP-binding protein|uniref:cAMP-binding domain of CRP or a regulatory subunit of cAMP-dependent protein kinases n=1 Tax=Ohtaekwangia koreensis TaxID=688867 RepID=A0A1T5LQI7_9BACT|nr:Crp/Fnr family transcriptional regulator [Ohtaekwangia koreensis]SKC77798.1 cAMP-binding domain of CRP or a regulatory subunit of cAMP-dependent protein kinases [Ohtaekwangia koreensis]